MDRDVFLSAEPGATRSKVGFMDVTSATNARTFITCTITGLPCGNKVPTLSVAGGCILDHLALCEMIVPIRRASGEWTKNFLFENGSPA
jgi:hypothetical protein